MGKNNYVLLTAVFFSLQHTVQFLSANILSINSYTLIFFSFSVVIYHIHTIRYTSESITNIFIRISFCVVYFNQCIFFNLILYVCALVQKFL